MPQNDEFNAALNDIVNSWDKARLEEFSKSNELTAIGEIDYSYAKSLKNDLFRSPKDSLLIKFFNSKGINNENHMGRIISVSLHRKLNNKPLNLDKQFESILAELERENSCLNKNKMRSERYFDTRSLNDTVTVRMPVNSHGSTFEYICPESGHWVFNDEHDLLIKGVLVKKWDSDNSKSKHFEIEVVSMNKSNIRIFSESISIGDKISLELEYTILLE